MKASFLSTWRVQFLIPVVDIFAGPGGLGEGFSALRDSIDERVFRIALSIEMDSSAHRTLVLRELGLSDDLVVSE